MGRQVGDFSLEALWKYKPELSNKPADFETFWNEQKGRIEKLEIPCVSVDWRDYPTPEIEVADLWLESWDHTPLTGLLVKPKQIKEGPVILHFHGYTGSCGLAIDFLKWVTLGVSIIAFDVRGQGRSPDYGTYQKGSRIPGWMLRGIENPETYYYTNVYRDILYQLRWIRSDGAPIQPSKLGVMGSSQGGGLALSAAGLDGAVDFCISDWPFLAHFERAFEVALSGPYMEIVNYFKWNDPQYDTFKDVFKTLGYIDSMHFCGSIHCPTLMAIGLEDAVTPPSTIFAAYNHLGAGDKKIEVYPQFIHELNSFHDEKKLQFIKRQIKGGIR
ncbi:cephalosporin-C deacetylase [Bacillus oleivorans]|uniref:Cephalosporin-C deacetylase n=1 Tax=Bacillus oleivorans TaxID=1448271 RepID=A0A285CYL4_9BACI|nr:alpha/beta fold hydrolase [Bacillus oleivorans]SNX72677.1 cephalosporin-C deacetylase [Bacillus oleivorans]